MDATKGRGVRILSDSNNTLLIHIFTTLPFLCGGIVSPTVVMGTCAV